MLIENKDDGLFLQEELEKAGIENKTLAIKRNYNIEEVKEKIWNNLNLIYVYTKTPGKERDYPPIALKKGSTIKDLAFHVHKDFIKKFNFAKVWGKSAKYPGMKCSIKHVLESGDIVELHTK